MSISDRSRKAMEDLGMTGYEIRVYTSLLEAGAMTAADISKKSGVPYSKIYEVLNSLEDKGWLESDSSRPQKFFPKSPSTALEAMRMRSENSFRESQAAIVNELMPIYTKSGIKEKPEIWVVRGVYNIAAKVSEIVENCQQELLVALPSVAQDVAKPMQPVLRTLYERGVKINVLASEDTSADIVRALSRVAEVKLKNGMFGGGVIGDGKHVMILLGEGMIENGMIDPIAIWADHAALAGFAKDYFHYLWADAKAQQKKANSNR
ncbi:TrmB family transcriptional regulator [Candidatus Nitrososphaera evergladensis]|nr:helix-turn-helix domain-containing protein [Candidatus Nitrososphaera evergladensis]